MLHVDIASLCFARAASIGHFTAVDHDRDVVRWVGESTCLEDESGDGDATSVDGLDRAFNNVACVVHRLALDETPRRFASFIYILVDARERHAYCNIERNTQTN